MDNTTITTRVFALALVIAGCSAPECERLDGWQMARFTPLEPACGEDSVDTWLASGECREVTATDSGGCEYAVETVECLPCDVPAVGDGRLECRVCVGVTPD